MIRFLPRGLVVALVASTWPLLSASLAGASTPTCIVSLSPTATDTLFTIGAGAQVKAVDQDSTVPLAAERLARKDKINALNPSAEAIAALCPSPASELVVISYNANDIAKQLSTLGVTVLEQDAPSSLSAAYAQIRQLGLVSGHAVKANALAVALQARILGYAQRMPRHPGKVVSVYYEISAAPYYSLTSSTFVGSFMRSLGVVNIADPENTSADAGYPSLNPEYIVKANPNLILLAGDATAAAVKQRRGWSSIKAVRYGHVVVLTANEASQWGFLLGDLAQRISASVIGVINDPRVWK